MNHINELITKARSVVGDADNHHRYSISDIYNVYNAITGRDEKKQNCTSCLLNKVKEIRQWLALADEEAAKEKGASAQNKKRGGAKVNKKTPRTDITNLSS